MNHILDWNGNSWINLLFLLIILPWYWFLQCIPVVLKELSLLHATITKPSCFSKPLYYSKWNKSDQNWKRSNYSLDTTTTTRSSKLSSLKKCNAPLANKNWQKFIESSFFFSFPKLVPIVKFLMSWLAYIQHFYICIRCFKLEANHS